MDGEQNTDDRQELSDIVMDATRALVGVAVQSIAEVSVEVSLAQYRVLVLLESRGQLAMGILAKALGANPSTATRVCAVLEDKGLVERSPLPDDKRVVLARLTGKGRSLVRRSLSRRRRLLDTAVSRLSPVSQHGLAQALTDLTSALGATSQHAWALGWPGDA